VVLLGILSNLLRWILADLLEYDQDRRAEDTIIERNAVFKILIPKLTQECTGLMSEGRKTRNVDF